MRSNTISPNKMELWLADFLDLGKFLKGNGWSGRGSYFPHFLYFQQVAGLFLVLVLTGSKFITKDLYDSL